MLNGKLDIAVVGCGPQGIMHIESFLAHPLVNSVVGVDTDVRQLASIETKCNIQTSTDYYDVIKDPVLDAAVIVSPNHTHLPYTLAAFEAGKDVLCEKPLSIRPDECKRLVDASREHGQILHCHFELRHSRIPLRIKEIIDSGEIGTVRSLNMVHYRGAFRPAWKGDPSKSGGLALMETCHAIDLFRFLPGADVKEVCSFAPPNAIDYYGFSDTEYLIMKLEQDIVCHLTSCHSRSADHLENKPIGDEWDDEEQGHDYEYTVLGTRGSLCFKAVRGGKLFVYHYIGSGETWGCQLDRAEDYTHVSHDYLLHGWDGPEFIDAVLNRRDTYISPEDAYRTHEVCFAVEESKRLGGTPIKIGQP